MTGLDHIDENGEEPQGPEGGAEAAALVGRRCAMMGLNLATAQMVFDALYVASAMSRSGGNKSEAARIAGLDRVTIHRMTKRGKIGVKNDRAE